jgi:signal transduction histidine kinase
MVTHELRTPLTSISAFTDILGHDKEGTLTSRQLEQLSAVSRNSTQLAALIDDLIHMSRTERGRFELTLGIVDLAELVRHVCESMTPITQHRGQALITSVEPMEVRLELDESRMTQVLNNLIANASKFSPADSTISVELRSLERHVQLSISDEGPGIDPKEAEEVFNPFYRVDNETSKAVPGTGLGLYVARSIVRQHGGTISIAPNSKKGTTLRVVLPLGKTLSISA